MTGGQIAALIFAILLLLPGGCFLFVGFAFLDELSGNDLGFVLMMVLIAAVFLVPAGWLFWFAVRRRQPVQPGPPPPL